MGIRTAAKSWDKKRGRRTIATQDSPALFMMKEVAALARLAEREVRSAGCWTILALPFLHSYTGHGTYSLRRKKVHTKYNTIQRCVLLVYSTSQLKKHPTLRHYSLVPKLSPLGRGRARLS